MAENATFEPVESRVERDWDSLKDSRKARKWRFVQDDRAERVYVDRESMESALDPTTNSNGFTSLDDDASEE